MCGIAGAIGAKRLDDGRINATINILSSRGPDAHGVFHHAVNHLNICLIHTRLSIIDLDPRANQPFEQNGLVLTYNGEIYNYLEIRKDLETRGHTFITQSDTEVVLCAYREWGTACFEKFEGMWALAILDTQNGTIVLSRDRFGEKPLYTYSVDGILYFASEIKALTALSGRRPSIDQDQIARYLVNGYKFLFKQNSCFFQNIEEFPAACFAEVSGPTLPSPKRYWRLSHIPEPMTMAEAAEGARERLFKSMELRLRADVPIAFCLSGGIDSCTLAGIAAKHFDQDIHCFSVIDSDERYDERENIRTMVEHLGCNHFELHTSNKGFFERMEKLASYHDSPVATISYYVHSFLSEAIHDNGYKVAVSGTAADEIFTGYYDHYSMWLAYMNANTDVDFDKLVDDWKNSYGAVVNNPKLQDPLAFLKNPDQRDHIMMDTDLFNSFLRRDFQEEWTETKYSPELLHNRMMNELFHESVPVILQEDDRNSMCWSVENRSPYLDRDLIEFMYTVPSEHLIHGGYAKWLLREAGKDVLPDSIRTYKRKHGFNASIDSIVDRTDPETRDRLLSDSPIFDLVDRSAIEGFLNGSMESNSFSKFLFSFISAKLFLESQQAETSAP
jgi:asparagine synthase (glutamine-hydrolysing)